MNTNLKNFYVLSDNADKKNFIRLRIKEQDLLSRIDKLVLGDVIDSKINFPIEFKWLSGSNECDLISCGSAFTYLISDKFLDVLRNYNFSGWDIFPVKVFDKNKNILRGYNGLSIIGRSGEINNNLSIKKRIESKSSNQKGYESYFGKFFDLNSWDGSDFFIPNGTFLIYVTENVRKALEKEELSNIEFKSISEIENLNLLF